MISDKGGLDVKYAVVRTFADDSFTVDFFDSWKKAREFASEARAQADEWTVSVIVYEASRY